jgi:hypothetical protein
MSPQLLFDQVETLLNKHIKQSDNCSISTELENIKIEVLTSLCSFVDKLEHNQ